MSRETERTLKELHKFIDEHHPQSEEELRDLAQQFMALKNQGGSEDFESDTLYAEDYMEMADNARTKKKKLEYIAQALELEPDNLDAALMEAQIKMKKPTDYQDSLKNLIKKGDQLMAKGGYFRDDTGEFWAVLETRPYMRVRYEYFDFLIKSGMLRSAAAEGEKMLQLCINDNLGVRYALMHVYAQLEEEAAAKKLYKKYDGQNDSILLLAMIVLYYKLNKFDIAIEYLKQLKLINKDTKKFVSSLVHQKEDMLADFSTTFGYRPYTIEELSVALLENQFLYLNAPLFFEWADKALKTIGSK